MSVVSRGCRVTLAAAAVVLATAGVAARPATASTLVGDVNGDCIVNGLDLGIEAQRYMTSVGSLLYAPRYDLNSDGVVNILDIQIIAAHVGQTC